jgi:hypothetical protein
MLEDVYSLFIASVVPLGFWPALVMNSMTIFDSSVKANGQKALNHSIHYLLIITSDAQCSIPPGIIGQLRCCSIVSASSLVQVPLTKTLGWWKFFGMGKQ